MILTLWRNFMEDMDKAGVLREKLLTAGIDEIASEFFFGHARAEQYVARGAARRYEHGVYEMLAAYI